MMKPASIIIIIPYFGKWPEWVEFFMLSCQANPSINWLFITDCGKPQVKPNNCQFIETSFADYTSQISQKLAINFNPTSPYKLCDIKPAYGYLHQAQTQAYDFFGFGDIDVIYGNLRQFLTDDILAKHQLISTHNNRISGHLCLLKNTPTMIQAFQRIKNWQNLFENPQHLSIDESKFTKVFMPHRKHPTWLKYLYAYFSPYWRHNYFKEQYSTILAPMPWCDGKQQHPEQWYWRQGHLSNNQNGQQEFMYLHFMNWKSNTWLPKQQGGVAAWQNLTTLLNFDSNTDMQQVQQFTINPKGFFLGISNAN